MNFITLNVKSMNESIEFYTKILGFKVDRSFSAGSDIQITFLNDGSDFYLELIQNDNEKPYSGNGISLGFEVDDIHEVEEKLMINNVKILFGPVAMKSGVILLHALDINGFELGFVQQAKK
jgi:lactoylglutathione lyase